MTPVSGRHDRQELARGGHGVPQLDAEHHHVDRTDGGGIIGHADLRQPDILRTAFDAEPALAQGGEMRSARNEMHVGAALDETGAEIAADATRPHDCNFHRAPSQNPDRDGASHTCPARPRSIRRRGRLPGFGRFPTPATRRCGPISCILEVQTAMPIWNLPPARRILLDGWFEGRRKGPVKVASPRGL